MKQTRSSALVTKSLWLAVVVLLAMPGTAMAAKKKRTKKAAEAAPAAQVVPAEAAPAAAPEPAPVPAAASTAEGTAEAAAVPASATAPATEPAAAQPEMATMAPVESQPILEPSEPWRLRMGLNAGIMMFYPGPSYGMNVAARGGIKFNELLSAYVDLASGFGLGGGGQVTDESIQMSISAVSYWRAGVLGEVNYGPLFVAAGPALFKGGWVGVEQAANSAGESYQEVYAVDGYAPALMGRAGFSFGGRGNFTLAMEAMAVFGSVASVEQGAGANGASQVVKTGDMQIGFSPVLVLGWDLN